MQNHELHTLQFIFIPIGFSMMSFKYFTAIDSVHTYNDQYIYCILPTYALLKW